jgi:APA family basic amino acid/polyamine antiporter
VLLAFLYGQSRIFFVMARDGLLPMGLAKVNPKTGTPVLITIFTAVIVAGLAGVFRLDEIAALANAGTLAAFVAVAACMLILRVSEPTRERVFRTPLAWIVGPAAIAGCIYLFFSLPQQTQVRFLIWNAIGLAVYFLYSVHQSRLAKAKA